MSEDRERFEIEIRDDRTDTWQSRYIDVPAKTGSMMGKQVEVASSTVATAICAALWANLDLRPDQHVVVDVHRISMGWSTYEFREVAFADVDLDVTIVSGSGSHETYRAQSWGRDGRGDSDTSIVNRVLFATIRRAIDDAFCCDEPPPIDSPPAAFLANISGPANTWGMMVGFGASFSALPFGDRTPFPSLPGPQLDTAFGGTLEMLARLPLDGLRAGLGFRGGGGLAKGPWRTGLPTNVGHEQALRGSFNLVLEKPFWHTKHWELYVVTEAGTYAGRLRFDTVEDCVSPECRLRRVDLDGWTASGGLGLALYTSPLLLGIYGVTLEAQAGVIRFDEATIEESGAERTLEADGFSIPTFTIDLGMAFWML